MDADRLIERLGELPSLPAVYHRVREAIETPDGSLETVAGLIESDPSMSTRVLRVANSPLYGLATEVDDIRRALTLIGTTATHHLVLSTTLLTVFRDLPLGAVSMRSFWEHGLACGVAARLIARQGGQANPEHAYLAGLLHDIGRLPLYILEPLDMSSALQAHRERQGHLHDLEQQYLGIDHTELGAILLAHWQLPEVFRSAVSDHHAPWRASRSSPETAVVHVADLIVNSLRLGTSGTRWVPVLDDGAWHLTGLDIERLPTILEATITATRDVISAFMEA
ncbi:HDOD domain-containing protein [Allochromatium humboldtianum]|uniref:HDOD domain-containing protein n=1 Tax=Allochromatium humboldtianum TaxID=504901 RepID=A0A850R8I5_9GAMM|nr:HDOD domain-containing protein [Allochromatium humboldtianum]NVZ09628.1 HDOD domain-containing protein [Allochromatium humboldtianum]